MVVWIILNCKLLATLPKRLLVVSVILEIYPRKGIVIADALAFANLARLSTVSV